MSVGQRIKARRKELNITLEELAKKLGKNRSTIHRYESGEIENLPIDILEPIAQALQTTPAYLMGWNDVKENTFPDTPERTQPYYNNEDAMEYAQFLFENPDYKVLFDASKKVKKEDLEVVKTLLDKFSDE